MSKIDKVFKVFEYEWYEKLLTSPWNIVARIRYAMGSSSFYRFIRQILGGWNE